jgi:AdoMet-dependent heme synthase
MYSVETANAIYNLEFCHLQLNITSRCNMRCKHCRGDYCGAKDLSLEEVSEIINFSKEHLQEGAAFLISGGEPLLHPQFKEIMKSIREGGAKFISITTNGSFLTKEILDYLDSLKFKQLRISISLDGSEREEVNEFRRCPTAFDDAIRAIKLVAKHDGIIGIVRTTIRKEQLEEVPKIVDLAYKLGANIFSISSIIPAGRAKNHDELSFDSKSKEGLLNIIENLRKEYPKLIMDVNDPLRCLMKSPQEKEIFGGCIAGIGSFSVEPDGALMPCPLMHNQKICNIKGKKGDEIMKEYKSSGIIHNLLDRNLVGKCAKCSRKNSCGGCRARAEAHSGNYLGEDPECFLR